MYSIHIHKNHIGILLLNIKFDVLNPEMMDKIEQEILWESSLKTGETTEELDLQKDDKSKFGLWESAEPFGTCENESEKWTRRFEIEKIYETDRSKFLYGKRIEICVEGEWTNIMFKTGMYIYFINCGCANKEDGSSDACSSSASQDFVEKWKVNDEMNFIVVESDFVTVTSFCGILRCKNDVFIRKNMANISFDEDPKAMVVGRIVHRLLEECLVSKRSEFNFVIDTTKRIIGEMGTSIYTCGSSEREMLNETLKHVRHIIDFCNRKMRVEFVEKGVLSREFGLRGVVDCVANNKVIEFKTGMHEDVSHRAQVMLYTAMMNMKLGHSICGHSSDGRSHSNSGATKEATEEAAKNQRHNNYVEESIKNQKNNNSIPSATSSLKYTPMLFFTKSGRVSEFEIRHREISKLLQLRNGVGDGNTVTGCECSEGTVCRTYQDITALNREHFLRRQLTAIEDESGIPPKYMRCVRAEDDNCDNWLARLKFTEDVPTGGHVGIYTRGKKLCTGGRVVARDGNVLTVQLYGEIGGCREFFVADEAGGITFKYMRWALIHVVYPRYLSELSARERKGFYLPKEKETVENGFNKKDKIDEDREYSDCEEFIFSDDEIVNSCKSMDSDLSFDSSNHMDSVEMKPNDDLPGKKVKLEESIYNASNMLCHKHGLNRPQIAFNYDSRDAPNHSDSSSAVYFTQQKNPTTNEFYLPIPEVFYDKFAQLNDGQKAALYEALNCANFKIIHGMPGTGKSTLIALLIKILAHYKKKVIVVCYTHFAINNIISKIGSLSYYRAGSRWSSKSVEGSELIRSGTNQSTSKSGTAKQLTISSTCDSASIRNTINSISLVFGTCYCFSDIVFIKNTFDYCIIDEGSQMHFLLSMIPISIARRFCILGDHLQLRPLAKKNKDIAFTVFEHLMKDCAVLTAQYRMGDQIMRLSNSLFYAQRLTGTGAQATVTFIDTRSHKYPTNFVGTVVLCYFNNVVTSLQPTAASLVTTIDKFQGSESDSVAVIFHPVIDSEIMQSRERLNVALTRAKKKLILIGNPDEMKTIGVFRELLELLSIHY